MTTPAFPVVLPAFSSSEIRKAVDEASLLLRSDQIVALPTETVYGLAANAFHADACRKIFEVKGRPATDPLIVHISHPEEIKRMAIIDTANPSLIASLIKAFWPGPLTLILPKQPIIPDIVTAGQSTVAIRCPSHPVFRAVLENLDFPLAAPSANRFARISPTTAEHVVEELGGSIPLIVDAGPCTHGLESTILMVTSGKIEILRHGPITAEMLSSFGEVCESKSPIAAPGHMKSHYAPKTPLVLIESASLVPPDQRHKAALLAWSRSSSGEEFSHTEILNRSGNFQEAAAMLYDTLRRLDHTGATKIYAELPSGEGLSMAIRERLRKAATYE